MEYPKGHKSKKNILLSVVCILIGFAARSQILHVGGKLDKKLMFNTTLNYPLFFEDKRPYELMLGMDYTTKNAAFPSGLTPQVTYGYFIVDDQNKDYLIFGGLTAGYLMDFNKAFDNQFRISPHVYLEYFSFLNLKLGYDYFMPLRKGYPFISIGFGGGHLFRHFKLM